ncbi:type I polyketide synthase, partial [Streptomyces sp. PT12]
MGAELYEAFPVFAEAWDEVVGVLGGLLDGDVNAVVWGGDEGLLGRTDWVQPALFAFEVALFRLVESWGVVPDVVVGHSVGEIAAACVSGVLSVADGCRLVVARGRLMGALPEGGAMVAVGASEGVVREVLGGFDEGVVGIAAVNGPSSVVVSGAEGAVLAIGRVFEERGVRIRRLNVSHAFHSPLMEPMLAEFGQVVAGLSFGESARFAVVSTLTGERIGAREWGAGGYWVRHVREGVRFADAVGVLVGAEGVRHVVEIGPDGTLSGMVGECLSVRDEGASSVSVSALGRRKRPELAGVLEGLARAWVAGVEVDWSAVCVGGRPVELPTYPFQRDRYW